MSFEMVRAKTNVKMFFGHKFSHAYITSSVAEFMQYYVCTTLLT